VSAPGWSAGRCACARASGRQQPVCGRLLTGVDRRRPRGRIRAGTTTHKGEKRDARKEGRHHRRRPWARVYPASDTVQQAMLPLVDRDGLAKPVLQIIAEEALDSGAEELCVVCAPATRRATAPR